MENQIFYLSQNLALLLILIISLIFVIIGVLYSKNYQNLSNYLTAGRNVQSLSLTTSLVASALGAWILFGPASAATWGGVGSVIGYALGSAFPMIIFIFLGTKIRKILPRGNTLTEFVHKKFGKNIFNLILILTIFYMFIFLCAEVTAVSMLINYVSGTPLWLTATLIIITTLTYTLYGGLRASIFTDSIQFFIVLILLFISFYYLFSLNSNSISFEVVKNNSGHLLSSGYIPNYTAGLTFFIAVAATNLFHQGNWQRVYAAKNNTVLKKSLFFSFLIIIPVVFFMGFTGLIAASANQNIIPDLAFFSLLLKEEVIMISVIILILAISLTVSSIDTLINAISSLIVVDGNKIINFKGDYLKLSKQIIIFLSIIAFLVSSMGFSILYLFLLADLFCCAAVLSIFYSFYTKSLNEKNILVSIIIGLAGGLLLFPSPDFSKSLLVGIILPIDFVPAFISQSLLFSSFIVATFLPIITWKIK